METVPQVSQETLHHHRNPVKKKTMLIATSWRNFVQVTDTVINYIFNYNKEQLVTSVFLGIHPFLLPYGGGSFSTTAPILSPFKASWNRNYMHLLYAMSRKYVQKLRFPLPLRSYDRHKTVVWRNK